MLRGKDHLGGYRHVTRSPEAAVPDEDGAAIATARFDQRRNALCQKELQTLLLKIHAERRSRGTVGVRSGRLGLAGQILELGRREAMPGRVEECSKLPGLCREHELAAQLAAMLVEVGVRLDHGHDRFCANDAARPWCPGLGVSDQRKRLRHHRMGHETLVRPSRSEWTPALQPHVRESPFGERSLGPLRGRANVRRVGQARAVHIGQPEEQRHDLGTLEAFVLDGEDGIQVDLVGNGCGSNRHQHRQDHRHRQGRAPHAIRHGASGTRSLTVGHAQRHRTADDSSVGSNDHLVTGTGTSELRYLL